MLRAPRTWEESHKVVLEFEQREAAHKAVANAVYTASSSSADPNAGELADTKKELAKLKAEVKAAAKAAPKAAANQTYATAKGKGKGGDAEKKICFHFRDHGNCPKKDSCPYSHDKELRKRALAARRDAGHQQTLATTKGGGKAGGKGGGKNGKPKAKTKAKAKAKSKAGAKPPGTVCPFFAKNGSCRKGANCDMVHSLATTGGNQVALPSNWGTAPSSASMSNPFAAFSIQIGSAGVQAGVLAAGAKGAESLAGGVPAAGSLPLQRSKGEKFSSVDELPQDWWHLAENEAGGGEVLNDPEAVYARIKAKHLVFGESREEREVRVDGEHASLAKFEPFFEASIAELEAVGLGKTPRELYLSYLRKMAPHLQKEIRADKAAVAG